MPTPPYRYRDGILDVSIKSFLLLNPYRSNRLYLPPTCSINAATVASNDLQRLSLGSSWKTRETRISASDAIPLHMQVTCPHVDTDCQFRLPHSLVLHISPPFGMQSVFISGYTQPQSLLLLLLLLLFLFVPWYACVPFPRVCLGWGCKQSTW